jgi:hypothetical protein
MPPRHYRGVPMQAWGSGATMPPPTQLMVPNIAFAGQCAHLPQPQQSVAIIGGYAARNMRNIAAIQSNANQMGEGNANIALELGRLHIALPARSPSHSTARAIHRRTDANIL